MRKTIAIFSLSVAFLQGAVRPAAGQEKNAFIVRNASESPRVMADGGLLEILKRSGFAVSGVETVKLTPAEEKEYGEWNRGALENRHIGRLVSARPVNEGITIGLLDNCVDVLGILAGLQHFGPPASAGAASLRFQR